MSAHDAHTAYCTKAGPSQIRFPQESHRCFEETAGSFLEAFVILYDFEALQVPPAHACSCPDDVWKRTWHPNFLEEEEKILNEHMLDGEAVDAFHRVNELLKQVMYLKSTMTPSRSRRRPPWEWEKNDDDESILLEHMVEQDEVPDYNEFIFVDDIVEDTFCDLELDGFKGRTGVVEDWLPKKGRKEKMCRHRTQVLREQPPFCYSLLLMDREGEVREKKTFVSSDPEEVADNFVMTVLNLADKYLPTLTPGEPMMAMTVEEEAEVAAAVSCYLCGEDLDGDRVRDHDHLTGRFLGVAHNACNLVRREKSQLTCLAHNFSGYDSHFLVRAFNRFPERIKRISAIPLTTEKFKSFTINGNIRFLDSMAFLASSLGALVETLVKSKCSFPILRQLVDEEEEKALLLRKGVYPYAFATSVEALYAAKRLPPISAFYSDLSEEGCTEEDYEHALKVWDKFGCANMMDYTVLYVMSDVYQLADVVRDFRQMIWSHFHLDMCRYLSLPHLAFDIMLKETGARIEHIKDIDMANYLQRGIRGGLSFVNLRYAERTESDCILYLDANALYSKAMSSPLPISGLTWMTEKELAAFDAATDVSEGGKVGYILTVDLDYPPNLHRSHNGYPMAAESVEILWDDLSPYSEKCLQHIYGKAKHRARKLSATFLPRRKYTLHGLNLQLYLKHGLKLVKIHSGIKFRQKAFLEPFITTCTEQRARACTKSLSDMWKCLCNACFGKFIESQHKRMDCRFNRTRDRALINTTSPLYKGTLICGEDLTISFHHKKFLEMKQCWAVGFTILEISKYIMQRLYYEEVRPALGEGNVALMMTDTDSFLIRVRNHTEEEALRALRHVMDFSNLPKDHPLFDDSRARVPGYLKTEVPKASIAAAACIKAKTYSIKADRQVEEGAPSRLNRAKGVKEKVKDRLDFDTYARCLRQVEAVEVEQRTLRSQKHRNQLLWQKKIAFSSFDDKRYQLCALHSVPYGSVQIKYDKEGRERAAKKGYTHICHYCLCPEDYN